MTINQLHKILGKLIDEKQGRRQVCVHKGSFIHPLEDDGCVILPVISAEVEYVLISDDDGGTAENKDGTERGRWCLVFDGGNREIWKDSWKGQ